MGCGREVGRLSLRSGQADRRPRVLRIRVPAGDSRSRSRLLNRDLTMETWRPIPEYDGWYEASNLGRIRRIRPSRSAPTGRVVVPHIDGYAQVTLFKDGTRNVHLVHRLVAGAFLGSCPKGKQVNHINGDKGDNRSMNLEYVTPSENTKHAIDLLGVGRGERHGSSRLTEAEVLQIRREYVPRSSTSGVPALAKKYGVGFTAIHSIVRRRSWR